MLRLLIANWKMNPQSFAKAENLAKAVFKFVKATRTEVVLCPPLVWLTDLSHKYYREVSWGAQDVFWEKTGAFTGEVSSAMLKNSKVTYVIVGHSERRRWLHETDEIINKKVQAALKAGLKVILCVGEPLSVRKNGFQAAKNFVKNQLNKDLARIKNKNLIVAYEPIWAIGTGKPDDPAETAEMSCFIKNFLQTIHYKLQTKVLYGGSVTSLNIGRILEYNEIDGALVGGASLKANEFKKIIKIASKYNGNR